MKMHSLEVLKKVYKLWNNNLKASDIAKQCNFRNEDVVFAIIHKMKKKYGQDLRWTRTRMKVMESPESISAKQIMED